MVKKPAWDDWAEYYDAVDGDRTPFIEFYGSLITSKIRSVIEIACGTGRITSALAERLSRQHGSLSGVRIVGTDESPAMLRIAKVRDDRITWVMGDMRTLIVEGPFDLVICCYNSLQMMLSADDLVQALRVARSLLSTEGLFAFDIYQPNPSYLNTPATNRLARSVVDDQGRHLQIREGTGYDSQTRVLTVDWRLVQGDTDSGLTLARARYQYRQYDRAEIDRLLATASLVVRERYGDFNRSPFTDTSKKQVLVCARL